MVDTFNRVSTAHMYDNAMRNLGTRQKSLADLQENLTLGKRVVRPSDDPVAAAQAERALTRINRIQSEQRQLEVQRGAIERGEATLGEAVGLVQEMRQIAVAAGGGTLTQNDRKTYAMQLQSLQDQFNEVINRKDANGMPLLGALGSALQPFVGPLVGGADYLFQGLPGQTASQGTGLAAQLDGHSALMFDALRDGVYNATVDPRAPGSTLFSSALQTSNLATLDGASYSLQVNTVTPDPVNGTLTIGYTLTRTEKDGVTTTTTPGLNAGPVRLGQPLPIDIVEGGNTVMSFTLNGTPAVGDQLNMAPSVSMMSTLDASIRSIAAAPDTVMAAQAVGQALANIDAGLERLHNMRGYAGELLNRADRISSDQEDRSIQHQSDRSRAEDLDMIQGITDFQNANVGYEAALKTYAQVQRLTLFNYIN